MHYYQFNIADYKKDTSHLTTVEHGIYRQLIDWYYLEEQPIPLETQWIIRRLRLGSDEETQALNLVLKEFFLEEKDGYHQARCDHDIARYKQLVNKNTVNGKKGGRPKAAPDAEVNPLGYFGLGLANPNESQLNNSITQEPNNSITNLKDLPANAGVKSLEKKLNGVPYKEIENLYHECLPMLPQIYKWSERRKVRVKSLWHSELEELAYWKNYFIDVSKSKFLTGRVQGRDGRCWKADFDFIINETNFIKIAEGKYDE